MVIGTGTAYAAGTKPASPAHAAPAAHAAPKANSADAPADAYFGRMGYSALSIRYHLLRLRAQLHMSADNTTNVIHDAQFVEDAFYLWGSKYPKDSWLAQTGFSLAELYASVPDPQARPHAERAYRFVDSHFPKTKYAHLSRLALQAGIPTPAAALANKTPEPSAPQSPAADANAASAPAADTASATTGASPAAIDASPVAAASPDAAPVASPSPAAKHKVFGF
jgi:hypothetical protein